MNESDRRTERRSNRLCRALQRIGLRPADSVAVLCCEDHAADADTAVLAARKAGASTLVLGVRERGGLEARTRAAGVRFVLACPEGAELWSSCSYPAIVVADAPGTYWWPAIENRESDAPISCTSRVSA